MYDELDLKLADVYINAMNLAKRIESLRAKLAELKEKAELADG